MDNGEFEPSGMVLAYLLAGAPAVVGTLWDVTDRDCDRASIRAGELWGLWEARVQEEKLAKGKEKKGDVEVARKEGSRKKRRVEQKEMVGTGIEGSKSDGSDSEKRSLVEAVRRSRSACYLRYLNGAAFVVYGIPVYLVD
jgi:separase